MLATFLILIHLLAAAALALWIPQWWMLVPTAALLLSSLGYHWFRHARLQGRALIVRAVWQTQGDWRVFQNAGDEPVKAELLADSFVHPLLIILNFRLPGPGGRQSLLVCRDSIDADSFRRLRARLNVSVLAADSG